MAELLDLPMGVPQAGRQLADHAVAGGQVVGQRGGLHGPILAAARAWRKSVIRSISPRDRGPATQVVAGDGRA